MKVPILAQCLAAEKARVTSRTVAASAAPSAYTPLLSSKDETECSQEELYKDIERSNLLGDVPTQELITCYRDLHDNPDKFSKLKVQIEDSPNKEFYKKICLLLDRLAVETQRQQAERKLQEEQKKLEDSLEANAENPIETIASLKKLADFFEKNGDYDRALPLYEAIFDKNKRTHGDRHPDTLASFYDFIKLTNRVQEQQEEQQRKQQAEQRKQQLEKEQKELENSLEASRRNLGEDPTKTIASLRKLADFFVKNNDYYKALPLYQECLDISKRVLGEDHPETLKSLEDIISCLGRMDRWVPPELYEELLAKQKRVLGEDDPETLKSLYNLTFSFYYTGDYDRALPLYEELLAKQKRLLREDHPDTLQTLRYIALIEERKKEKTGESLGGKSKNKRNHKNKSFRSTRRRRRRSRARGGKKMSRRHQKQ